MLGNCYTCPDWQLIKKFLRGTAPAAVLIIMNVSLATLQTPGVGKQLEQTGLTRPPQAA